MPVADQLYKDGLKKFTAVVKRLYESSTAAKNVDAGQHRYWASVIVTRICSLSASVLWVCPGSVLNPRSLTWDFEGVAALCRSTFEAILMLFYFLEQVSEDEWKLRIKLVHLADCTERIRLFHWMGGFDDLAGFVPTAVSLRAQIEANPVFQSLPERVQKELRTGNNATLFGKGEIIRRANEDPEQELRFYRFISNYVHCLPLGFHRTAMHNRSGTENEVDKSYMGMTLDFTAQWLEKAVKQFETALADLVTFGTGNFDFSILMKPTFTPQDEALIQRVFSAQKPLRH
jgi:hypothetical protein